MLQNNVKDTRLETFNKKESQARGGSGPKCGLISDIRVKILCGDKEIVKDLRKTAGAGLA